MRFHKDNYLFVGDITFGFTTASGREDSWYSFGKLTLRVKAVWCSIQPSDFQVHIMNIARLKAAIFVLATTALFACGTDGPEPLPDRTSETFTVRASLEQVYVRYLDEDLTGIPGTVIELVDADGVVVQSGEIDQWGGLVFRNVPPAAGYYVRLQIGRASCRERV